MTFKDKIYIDILVLLNLFINYFILLSVSKFLYIKVKRSRLLLGASLGAFYSIYILIPEPNKYLSFFIKVLMSISIVLSSFKFNKKMFLKTFICFFLISLSFSGIILAMWFMFKPKGMIVNNGMVYFDISPFILIFSTLVSYIFIECVNRYLGKHICKEAFCHIKLILDKKTDEFEAKLDTGNSLKEPFSNLPVIIVDREKVKNIIPTELNLNDYKLISEFSSKIKSSVRLIPFSGISRDGFLFGFKPDNVTVETGRGNFFEKEAYVGICTEKKLQYALVGTDILNNV